MEGTFGTHTAKQGDYAVRVGGGANEGRELVKHKNVQWSVWGGGEVCGVCGEKMYEMCSGVCGEEEMCKQEVATLLLERVMGYDTVTRLDSDDVMMM